MPAIGERKGPRTYTVRGSSEKVPSVTTVLGVLDGVWMNTFIQRVGRKEADWLKNEAAVLGVKIHSLAERVARTHKTRIKVQVEPEMQPYLDALQEFFDLHVDRVLGTEIELTSREMRFGGTTDLYCLLTDGTFACVDFKSKKSGGVTNLHRLQTAGYALLLKEAGYTVNKRIVVRLHTSEKKRGKWYARSAPDHVGDIKGFLACVELWWFLNGHRLEKSA